MLFRFSEPYFLLLLLLLPLIIFWYIRRHRSRTASIRFSSLQVINDIQKTTGNRARHILFVLRMAAVALCMIAFARPQSGIKGEEVSTQGVDIVLAVDISSSMKAEDIKPNRLEGAKQVAREFIQGRKNDRIGMVVFSADAFTQCPLTLDYGILLSFLDEIYIGMIEDGTAIGMGLATAVNRLRTSEAKSKVIILLTDGRNNRGEVDPLTAADASRAFGIKVYTVGAGTHGTALFPYDDPFFGRRYIPMPVDIDEASLKEVAEKTGGRYFRATDRKSLTDIFKEIDALEKTEIRVTEFTRYSELFHFLVWGALLLLLAEVVLANTVLRKIP